MEIRLLSSLAKSLNYEEYPEFQGKLSCFVGERLSFQLLITDLPGVRYLHISADCPEIALRQVQSVPVHLAAFTDSDEDYIGKEPGLYPDILTEIVGGKVCPTDGKVLIWADFVPDKACEKEITFTVKDSAGEKMGEKTVAVTVFHSTLSEGKLIYTRWFHADSLAQFYHVKVFSEKHWKIMENFIRCAASHGMNMILTPIHTPPLDTEKGGERLTVQLVDIDIENGSYVFHMDKLRRWIRLCTSCGIKYFEMAHLFTQWGAGFAPKIVARENGKLRRIFGWETPCNSPEYAAFLRRYIPALQQLFREENIADRVFWHISDEPTAANMASYIQAKNVAAPLLQGEKIMDALSHWEFFENGTVSLPCVATDSIMNFVSHLERREVPEIWAYYCCGQGKDVSNQFIAMPSCRTRILGLQLYAHRIPGFLHWGFNFYQCALSLHPVNPFLNCDSEGAFPAGDPFQVYPGGDGKPVESLRLMVTEEALQDLRALQMLENLTSRQYVLEIMEQHFGRIVTIDDCRVKDEELLSFREKINEEIAGRI